MEELEIEEVFRGHFDDCMLHFSKRLKEQKTLERKGVEFFEPIRAFCNVASLRTIKSWLDNPNPIFPNGEYRIKAIYYLWLHGYTIIEFDRLSSPIRGAAELIGFGVISGRSLSDKLDYIKTGTLYDVIFKKTSASVRVIDQMREIWKENREELAQRKKYCFDNLCFTSLTKISSHHQEDKEPVATERVQVPGSHRIKPTISIMQVLLEMLNHEDVKNLSQEELRELEPDTGMIIELSSRLGALSSKIISAKAV